MLPSELTNMLSRAYRCSHVFASIPLGGVDDTQPIPEPRVQAFRQPHTVLSSTHPLPQACFARRATTRPGPAGSHAPQHPTQPPAGPRGHLRRTRAPRDHPLSCCACNTVPPVSVSPKPSRCVTPMLLPRIPVPAACAPLAGPTAGGTPGLLVAGRQSARICRPQWLRPQPSFRQPIARRGENSPLSCHRLPSSATSMMRRHQCPICDPLYIGRYTVPLAASFFGNGVTAYIP